MPELVKFCTEDSQEFFVLTDKNRAYLKRWLPWLDTIKEKNDTEKFIRKAIQSDLEKKSLNFFIKDSGAIIGTIGLRDITDQEALVGYWIDRDHQGQNIITTSLKALIGIVKQQKLTNSILLRCSPENKGSLAIARKCQFNYEKTLKNAENLYGTYNDLEVYKLAIFP
ncbi:MAG: GNAT family N-acetyltransferase [Neisseriaceae bacterium]